MEGFERPEGSIKVYFVDNTYKTLALMHESTVQEVIEILCKRQKEGDTTRHELLVITPGTRLPRERRLQNEDRPLEIQAKGGATAFKFLFREVAKTIGSPAKQYELNDRPPADSEFGGPLVLDAKGLKSGILQWRATSEQEGWLECHVALDENWLWYSPTTTGDTKGLPLCDCDKVCMS
eukprot:5623712-Amphidinium_carterae.1